MSLRIEAMKEKDNAPYVQLLSEMRIKAFKEFPYLYVGNVKDDLYYTSCYTMKHGLLVLAFQDDNIIGIYSAMPMNTPTCFLEDWSRHLAAEGIDVNKCFYAGELIVDPAFQQRGIGFQLFKRLVLEVDQLGYDTLAGVTVIRPKDHPQRPKDYYDSDAIWIKYGYKKLAMVIPCTYPTLQEDGSVKDVANDFACVILDVKEIAKQSIS
jgi:GNAT superfamily N-acetyltransferase